MRNLLPTEMVYKDELNHLLFNEIGDIKHGVISDEFCNFSGFSDTPNININQMKKSLDKQIEDNAEDEVSYENIGNLGGAIEEIMNQLGLNMAVVAERANIHVSYLSMIINNKRVPHINKISLIAKALNDIPVSYIFIKAKLLDKTKDESKMTLREKQGMLLEPVLTNMIMRIYGEEAGVLV